jgi:hypothetical protein
MVEDPQFANADRQKRLAAARPNECVRHCGAENLEQDVEERRVELVLR